MPNVDDDADKLHYLHIAGGNVNWYNQPPLKTIWHFLKETKHATSIWHSNCTPGHLYERNKDLWSDNNLYRNIYRSFIIAAKNWKQPKPFIGWMANQILAISYHGLLLSNKKKQTNDITQQSGWISKELCWVNKSQSQRLPTVGFHSTNILSFYIHFYLLRIVNFYYSW